LKAPANTEEKQGTSRWVTGQSGNPSGRPQGSRNRATLLAQSLLNEEAERLVRRCIELAIAGNPMCIKLCLERILPPTKERPIQLDLQPPRKLDEVIPAMNQVVLKVVDGTIGPQEGNTLMTMLATTQKTLETLGLEQRIEALESILQSRKLA